MEISLTNESIGIIIWVMCLCCRCFSQYNGDAATEEHAYHIPRLCILWHGIDIAVLGDSGVSHPHSGFEGLVDLGDGVLRLDSVTLVLRFKVNLGISFNLPLVIGSSEVLQYPLQ